MKGSASKLATKDGHSHIEAIKIAYLSLQKIKLYTDMKKIKVPIYWTGKNYCACIGEMNGVVVATHKTLEEVKKAFEFSLKLHIESWIADGDNIPEYIRQGDYKIEYEMKKSSPS